MTSPTFLFRPLLQALLLIAGMALVFDACDADAAPLEVRSHQANLYGGRMAIAVVTVDVTVKHPVRAVVYVNGLVGTDDGDWPQLWHIRLHKGRNRIRSDKALGDAFYVRHWERVVPGHVARPDRWTAEVFTSVYADLTFVGHAGRPVARVVDPLRPVAHASSETKEATY